MNRMNRTALAVLAVAALTIPALATEYDTYIPGPVTGYELFDDHAELSPAGTTIVCTDADDDPELIDALDAHVTECAEYAQQLADFLANVPFVDDPGPIPPTLVLHSTVDDEGPYPSGDTDVTGHTINWSSP